MKRSQLLLEKKKTRKQKIFLPGDFFVGLSFPVNESTREHMKLVFFPM